MWAPDVEEQRFCWQCQTWFHAKCLPNAMTSQAQWLQDLISEFCDIPKSIIEVAYQPTARGGSVHFTSGNICLVNMARELLVEEEQRDILAKADPWMATNMATYPDDDAALWWEYLIYENNIDEKDKAVEQLVVKDQAQYTCPCCNSASAWL
jgi:hypothetical protein